MLTKMNANELISVLIKRGNQNHKALFSRSKCENFDIEDFKMKI